ncbi:MAG: hypothetical protein EHM49_00220 [Deltaproteobacteria bacterium]|nr:MAG: hypothetical protein EHM49_00220 [Deltaproteobacteria bacterium]
MKVKALRTIKNSSVKDRFNRGIIAMNAVVGDPIPQFILDELAKGSGLFEIVEEDTKLGRVVQKIVEEIRVTPEVPVEPERMAEAPSEVVEEAKGVEESKPKWRNPPESNTPVTQKKKKTKKGKLRNKLNTI